MIYPFWEWILNSHIFIVLLCISLFRSDNIFFMYLDALILGKYIFKLPVELAFYHYVMTFFVSFDSFNLRSVLSNIRIIDPWTVGVRGVNCPSIWKFVCNIIVSPLYSRFCIHKFNQLNHVILEYIFITKHLRKSGLSLFNTGAVGQLYSHPCSFFCYHLHRLSFSIFLSLCVPLKLEFL